MWRILRVPGNQAASLTRVAACFAAGADQPSWQLDRRVSRTRWLP
jgi:hypothetical protein